MIINIWRDLQEDIIILLGIFLHSVYVPTPKSTKANVQFSIVHLKPHPTINIYIGMAPYPARVGIVHMQSMDIVQTKSSVAKY